MIAFLPISTWARETLDEIHAHYPKSRGAPPGKKLAWRIYEEGRFRGLIAIGEAPFALSARKALGIPIHPPQPGTVACFIYRVQPGAASASSILRLWHPLAELEWHERYGEPIVHWETMVDPAEVRSTVPGACFRRAGWRCIGETTGKGAKRPPGRSHGKRLIVTTSIKLVFYRGPLARLPRAA